MFTVVGPDNDIFFFEGRKDLRRCDSCGALVRKWEEDLSTVRIPRRPKYDISVSYDGVDLVSTKFREIYSYTGMTGLRFIPLNDHTFVVRSSETVRIDLRSPGVRLVGKCEECGRYESAVRATPTYLQEGTQVPDIGFARTDIEFGSVDEQRPSLVCGDVVAATLREGELKGVYLKEICCWEEG